VKDPEVPDQLVMPVKGVLEFEKVDFFYPSRPNIAALDNFSLKVNSGETIALVGPSGAGKSTIFQLLLRFFDPTSGKIMLDGKPIISLEREEFRKHISIVTQDPVIFGLQLWKIFALADRKQLMKK